MRAVRRTESGIEVVEAPRPSGDGIRVRVRAAGICQTDLNLAQLGPLPNILGHELAGELGDGTPVGIEPLRPCGSCEPCRIGDYHVCANAAAMVIGIAYDGGMAEEILVPERCLVPLPPQVPVSEACLIEPLAVNLHGLDLARLRGGQSVAVVGTGLTNFGLLAAVGAQYRGNPVDLHTESDHHAAAADRLGIGTRVEGSYDLVIESDGSEASIAKAIEHARPGGTVLLVAGYYTRHKQFPVVPCVLKELHMIWGTFYGHHAGGRDVDSAAALLAQRPEIAEHMITHRFPLDAAADAFALCMGPEPSGKVVLEP